MSALPYRPSTNGTTRSSNSTGDNSAHSANTAITAFPSRTSSNSSRQHEGLGVPAKGGLHRRGASDASAQTASRQPSREQMQAPAPTTAKRRPRLRSQYPAHSYERHVEYILVASFDIDRGPTMEHQYPGPISGNENMLAELMLPDQAHVRSEDWTIFFLHKDTSEEEALREERRLERQRLREERQQQRRAQPADAAATTEDGSVTAVESMDGDTMLDLDEEEEEDEEDGQAPPLIYVLNLVNTKQDNTVKRGAIVKAMAVCTRHSFLHIYKPLLLLALEEYFKNPFPETLEHLYDAVNSMDLSLMPRLNVLERQILIASDAQHLFIEKFEAMIKQRQEDDRAAGLPDDISSPNPDPSSRAMPPPPRYQLPRDTHEYETRVVYNSIPIPIKVPTAASPETVGDFSLIKLIQTFSTPHATAPQPFPLHAHLTTSGPTTHPIIVLLNAILTEKRVIFLGHNRPSGEVAAAVLAACALAAGGGAVLRGFTRHAFPYTDLTKIDELLTVPGFIAGVTNPAFAHHPEWWDVLCDLPSGRVKISPRVEPALPTEGLAFFQQQHPAHAPSATGALPPAAALPASHHHHAFPAAAAAATTPSGATSAAAAAAAASLPSAGPSGATPAQLAADPTGDALFVDDLLRSIAARHGEAALRAKCRAYVLRLTRLAAAFEEAVYGASALAPGAADADADARGLGVRGHGYVWPDEAARARDLGAHAWRIEGWRNSRSYYNLVTDLAALWHDPGGSAGDGAEASDDEDADTDADGSTADPPSARPTSPPRGRGAGLRVVRGLDVAHQLDRLRTLRLGAADSARAYGALARGVRGYDAVCQLLAAAPAAQAGLFYLGLGLFHRDRAARRAVAALLGRVRAHAAGRHWWAALGRFVKVAYWRVVREVEAEARRGGDGGDGGGAAEAGRGAGAREREAVEGAAAVGPEHRVRRVRT